MTFTSPRYGYSIDYPVALYAIPAGKDGWDEIVDGDGRAAIDDAEDILVRMRTRKRPRDVAFVDILAADIRFFRKGFEADVLSRSKVRIGSYSGRLVTMMGRRDGRPVLIQYVLVVTKSRMFQTYTFTKPGDERGDRAMFDDLYRSFRPG